MPVSMNPSGQRRRGSDPLGAHPVVGRFDFDADELAAVLDAGLTGGSAAHERIEHDIALGRMEPQKTLCQFDRLARGVVPGSAPHLTYVADDVPDAVGRVIPLGGRRRWGWAG